MTTGPETPNAELVFFRRESTGSSATWCLVGGIALLVFSVFGFLLAVVAQTGQLTMHALTTVPALFGVSLIAVSRLLARTPTQVTVGPQEVCIETNKGRQCHPWEKIGWCAVGTSILGHRKYLRICDVQGKTIVTLGDALEDFDTLVEQVQSGIARKEDGVAQTIEKRKGRKSALLTAAVALALSAASIACLWMAFEQRRATRLLNEASVPGEAQIVRRFTAPNGITRRLEYRVESPSGETATRNAEVTPAYWDRLEDAKTVPVIYVPQEPAISRLAEGEVESDDIMDSPTFMIGLSLVMLTICAVLSVAAVMQLCGWDIDLDSKTGKLSIKRLGAGQ